jgi:hypothetical protein
LCRSTRRLARLRGITQRVACSGHRWKPLS